MIRQQWHRAVIGGQLWVWVLIVALFLLVWLACRSHEPLRRNTEERIVKHGTRTCLCEPTNNLLIVFWLCESAQPPSLWNRPGLLLRYLITRLTPVEKAGLERSKWFDKEGRGYFMQQSTQPQTLGYGLADSPVGLLGWIYEKLLSWTDDYPWTDDEGEPTIRTAQDWLTNVYLNSS